MKTFKDFLEKELERRKILDPLHENYKQAALKAHCDWIEYQENYKRQEELKKEVIKRIEENEIFEITFDPNYNVYMSLLTIVFKNTKQC